MESPARATEVPILIGIPWGVGAAARATGAAVAAAAGAAGGGAAGSPSSAVISASFSGATPLRLRLAFSAAIEDLLHFLPAATCFATSGLMLAETATVAGGAGAAEGGAEGVGVVAAGAAAAGAVAPAPLSQGIGTPALRASISASLNSGKLDRLRYACSAEITELFSALRGQTGRRPRTPESAIRPYPFNCDTRPVNPRQSTSRRIHSL